MARASGSVLRAPGWQADAVVAAARQPDQAAGLRHLLDDRPLPRLRILPVAGTMRSGKSGVVAALASHAGAAERVLVLDQSANEVARHAGLRPQHDLFDLVSGRHNVDEVVARAGNWRLLAARRGLRQLAAAGASIGDVYSGFLRLREPVSLLLVNLDDEDARALLPANGADLLLVTTPGNDALTAAYARIKQLAADVQRRDNLRRLPEPGVPGCVRVLINGADSYADARRVYRVLAETARNFLDIDLAYAGFLPPDRAAQPFGCSGRAALPACDAALARLAASLSGWRLAEFSLPGNALPAATFRRGGDSRPHSAAHYAETVSRAAQRHFEQGV